MMEVLGVSFLSLNSSCKKSLGSWIDRVLSRLLEAEGVSSVDAQYLYCSIAVYYEVYQ